tara:strand:+ start:356 stop:844 length:489 start_codon:yes stop_codon:yes gene_type:complete
MMNNKITEQCEQLAALLLKQNKTLAVAESCSGGWLSKVLTDLAGSSQWFMGSVVCYSNNAKRDLLNVDATQLEQFGAVSSQVAEQLADGAQSVFNASMALSITGIAGPSGGSPDKPIGLVWFAVKQVTLESRSFKKIFNGDREKVRQQAVETALQLMIDSLP